MQEQVTAESDSKAGAVERSFFMDTLTQGRISACLRDIDAPTVELSELAQYTIVMLRSFLKDAEGFDFHCRHNIRWIGQKFLEELSNVRSNGGGSQQEMHRLFCMCFRFCLERDFFTAEQHPDSLRSIRNFVTEGMPDFPNEVRSQLTFALYAMPAEMLRGLVRDPALMKVQTFLAERPRIEALKEDWDRDIAAREKRVGSLRDVLANLEESFNFVALTAGFQAMSKQKLDELATSLTGLKWLAAAIVVPIISELLYVMWRFDSLPANGVDPRLLMLLGPLAAYEIVVVYFFRVVLSHYRSLKAQLLQLDQRKALCQFIQSYATYASEIKKADPSALEKFENIVFSGLIASEEQLPSTFDGVDQLAKLLQNFRGSPK